MSKKEGIKQQFFHSVVQSWWVVLFFLFSFIVYDQSIKIKNRELVALKCRYDSIENKKDNLIRTKEDLLVRRDSCQDPEWVEQLLIKELGVVPSGYMKIYFKKDT